MPLSKARKTEFHAKMTGILSEYNKVFIVDVTNVGSKQMNDTRYAMRGSAEMLMGKNTMMRKVLKDFLETNPDHLWKALDEKLIGNVGFIFTNDELTKVRDFIEANRVPAPARAGAIAPVDVTIPKGPTGCDPGQTNFFQTLQIPTKIVKGQIEITSDVGLIKVGQKIEAGEVSLLNKLNIRPFSYGLVISEIFDDGAFFSAKVLDIDAEYIASKFSVASRALACLSFAIGHPTAASVPHSVANAFKTCVAITIGLDNFSFDKADEYKAALA